MGTQKTQQDYINLLQQLSPQRHMQGEYQYNLSVMATPLSAADNQIQDFNYLSFTNDQQDSFLPKYLSDWDPLVTPTDTTQNVIAALEQQMTAYANRGSQCMLPWGADKTQVTGVGLNNFYSLGMISSSDKTFNSWHIEIGGWHCYAFENIVPFFYAGYTPWNPSSSTELKQLYATPLNSSDTTYNRIQEINQQWIVNVELIPTYPTDASSVTQDVVENKINEIFPAWVETKFFATGSPNSDAPEMRNGTQSQSSVSSLNPNAKMIFNNQSIVVPSWLNTIYLSGGHNHDGEKIDGHASKINLSTNTSNVLNISTQLNLNGNYGTTTLILSDADFFAQKSFIPANYLIIGNLVSLYINSSDNSSVSDKISLGIGDLPANILPPVGTWISACVSDSSGVSQQGLSAFQFDGTNFNLSLYDGTSYNFNGFTNAYKGFRTQTISWLIS
jgi:hypothetical protein